MARRRAIGGGVAVLALLAVIAFFVTRGGGLGPLGGNSSGPPPKFTFTLKGVTSVAIEKGGDRARQNKNAHDAANGVQDTLDRLYSYGYVDSDTWGDPGKIRDFFTGGATDQVDPNLDALTLGKDADSTYDFVDPGPGSLAVKILSNGRGDALRAFAKTTFVATATHKDGTFTKITATGSFFLVKVGNAWKIESFDVNRVEKPTAAPAGSSSSPSEAAP